MDTSSHKTAVVSRKTARRRRGGGCLLIVLLLPLVYYGLYFALRGPRPANPQLIAHRGAPVYEPENTLRAFNLAIGEDVDWLEMDVQRTRDGVLVVFHDETVERTTNGTGQLADLTLAELQALDAGEGETIPTFAEVIALAKTADVGLLPEAKSPHLYPGMAAEMVQALHDGEYAKAAVIQSFDHDTIVEILQIDPDMAVCPLYGLWQMDLRQPPAAEIDWLCPMAEMIVLNPWMIKQAHDADRQVYVWFGALENQTMMRFMLALGADGLMVDDPLALAEILER